MIKKILTSLVLLSLICVVLVGAETNTNSAVTSGTSSTSSSSTQSQDCVAPNCIGAYKIGEYHDDGCPVIKCPPENCVGEGESLGAVVPGNNNQCCAGLSPYVPEGIVGTRGTCMKCADVGENVYVDDSDGSTICCSGLTLDPIVGSSTMKGRCVQNNCPQIAAPICDEGMKFETFTGANGCLEGKCVSTDSTTTSGGTSSTKTCQVGCICNRGTITCPNEQQSTITTEIQTTSVGGTSTQDETSTSTISISKTGTGGTSIQSGDVEVITSENVSVINSKLTMQTSTGSTKEIKVMPNEVSVILGTSSIETNELKEESEKAVYSVTGTKKGKIIAVFPVEMKISAKVDAETGSVISIEKPWWSFLTKEVGTGVLNTIVVDANTGEPVVNALVIVEEEPGSGSSMSTDESGLASFILEAGDYVVEIEHEDYESGSESSIKSVTVTSNETSELDFFLIRLPDFDCAELIPGTNDALANKINLVFVGYGYENAPSVLYAQAYGIITDSNGLFSIDPYGLHQNKFNLWYIPQSGSLSEDCTFTNDYSCQNHKYIRACPANDRYIVHLINSTQGYSTGGNPIVLQSADSVCNADCRAITFVHEFGHSFGLLLDEYVSNPEGVAEYTISRNCYAGPDHTQEECLTQAPWKDLIGNGCGEDGVIDCIETDLDYNKEVGCYEGCNYLGIGIFRATRGSYMVDGRRFPFFGLWNEKLLTGELNKFGQTVQINCESRQQIGDVDGDDDIDSNDENLVAEIVVGNIPKPENICCVDVSQDDKLSVTDVVKVSRIVAGMDPSPGLCD